MHAQLAVCTAAIPSLVSGFATAAPISYEDQTRRTNIYSEFIEAPLDTGFDVDKEVGLGSFRSDLAFGLDDSTGRFANGTAFQSSELQSHSISASHRVSSTTRGGSYAAGMSLLFIEFGVPARLDTKLAGAWSFSRSSVAAGLLTEVTLTRISNTGDVLEVVYDLSVGTSADLLISETFNRSLSLEPGRYQLLALTLSSASTGAQSEATLDYAITFIPAPGSLCILFALGLGAARRRREADLPPRARHELPLAVADRAHEQVAVEIGHRAVAVDIAVDA